MKSVWVTSFVFVGVFLFSYAVLSGQMRHFLAFVTPRPETSHELIRELEERHFGVSPFWLERHGISVQSATDVEIDLDDDGLTLLEEYTYLTNPLVADTDGDGYDDGKEVRDGFSPIGPGRLDANENGLPDDWEKKYSLIGEDASGAADTDADGLSNEGEYLYGTDPLSTDTDADGFTDGREVRGGYDPGNAGDIRANYRVSIDRINIDAPVVLSKDAEEEALQRDLRDGVIHYPGMALPGRRGNSYIAGHSSHYAWSPGSYNSIFQDLNQVVVGDEIIISEVLSNGRTVRHHYQVSMQEEVEADDERIFQGSQSSVLTLTTCWPLGTADRRIMIKAHLIETRE